MKGLEFYGAQKNQVIGMMKDLVSLKGIPSVIQLF